MSAVKALSPDPSIEVIVVTPELASIWLAANTHNRNLRQNAVTTYARDMTAAAWRWTGDPIRFDVNGVLIDGQHRLAAIVASGASIPLLVVRDLAPEAQEEIDQGMSRSFADVLTLRGEAQAASLSTLVRRVWNWYQVTDTQEVARGITVPAFPKPSISTLLRVLDDHPELRDVNRKSRSASVHVDLATATTLGLAWWLFDQIDTGDAEFFFSRLVDGQDLHAGNPIYELRRTLKTHRDRKSRHGGESSQRYILALLIKSWNFYRSGETVRLLKFKLGGANPESFPTPV